MRLTIAYSKIKKRNLVLINNVTHQRARLRNPREHGSATPRQKIRMAEKFEEYLKKSPEKEKKGSECRFCSLIWHKLGSFRELCPLDPRQGLGF